MVYRDLQKYKLWVERNKEKKSKYNKEWKQKNKQRIKEYQDEYNKQYYINNLETYIESRKYVVTFLGKKITLTFTPRTGYCSRCPNNVFDKSCRRTSMHHLKYIPCMKWACIKEVCNSCHAKLPKQVKQSK